MAEGEEKGKLLSFIDKQKQQTRNGRVSAGGIDYSQFGNPEKARQSEIDKRAIEIQRLFRADPRVSPEAIAGALPAATENRLEIERLLERTSHADWVRDPVRFYLASDERLKDIDRIAQRIVNAALGFDRMIAGEDLGSFAESTAQADTGSVIQLLRNFDAGEWNADPRYLCALAREFRARRANGIL